MENQLQITNSEKYFLEKKETISEVLQLPNKTFLQKSYSFEKLSQLKKDANFVFLIGGWITQTSALMQIKNPIDNFIKQDIVNMLGGHWSNLSIEELIKAFELERFGAYEDKTEHYQLFDCSYIAQILKKYQKWSREKKIELNITNQNLMEENKISESDQFKIMTNAINEKYKYFLETGKIEEPVIHIFKELIERGFIKMPNKETPKLYAYYDNKLQEAKNQIIHEYENTTEPDKFKRKELKSILASILNNDENLDAKSKIENRAKKLVLLDFFNKQKNNNIQKII
jgi:hypothetical protein